MRDLNGMSGIRAEAEVPIWSVNHFLDQTSSNYLKIVTLRELCALFQEGAEDSNFRIAAESFELFPERRDYEGSENLIHLASKGESAESFWYHFRHLHRPVVLVRRRGEFYPLFDFKSDQALNLRNLSKNSPWDFDFEGKIAALFDLFSGRTFARRQNEDLSKALHNVRDIVETSRIVEEANIPQGVREFASHQLEAIMNKQHKINRRLGIKPRYFEVKRRHD